MGIVPLTIIIVLQAFILYLGQRYIFAAAYNKSKFLTYLLVAPGTALHELAHWFMCIILRVPAELPVLFKPQKNEDGSMTLGYVNHAQSDPLRGALVAIAPVIFVPLLLLGVFIILFSGALINDPFEAVSQAAVWKIVLAAYLTLSAGTGAFPSPGDHIGFIGGVLLVALGVVIIKLLGSPEDLFRWIAFIWAPAAFSALLLLFLFYRPRRP